MIKFHYIAPGRWQLRTWISVINRTPTFRAWENSLIRHNLCQALKVRKSSRLKLILTLEERGINPVDRVVADLEWIRMPLFIWALEIETRIWARLNRMKWMLLDKFLSHSKAQAGIKGPQPWVPTTSQILWTNNLKGHDRVVLIGRV